VLLQQGQALAAAPEGQPFALPASGPSADLEALLAPGAVVRNPGVGWAFNNRQRQLFYPPWVAGTWQVCEVPRPRARCHAAQPSCPPAHPPASRLAGTDPCHPCHPRQVSSSFRDASFPLGQRFLSRATPGATKASLIAALADVGAGMDAPVTYQARCLSRPVCSIADD
jgi:hypothetical protein